MFEEYKDGNQEAAEVTKRTMVALSLYHHIWELRNTCLLQSFTPFTSDDWNYICWSSLGYYALLVSACWYGSFMSYILLVPTKCYWFLIKEKISRIEPFPLVEWDKCHSNVQMLLACRGCLDSRKWAEVRKWECVISHFRCPSKHRKRKMKKPFFLFAFPFYTIISSLLRNYS